MGKRRLFGTAGIRGPYLEKVSPDLAFNVGLALATYLKRRGCKGTVNVGYDCRLTSPLLALSVSTGLMCGGINVYFLGLVPTPTLAFSIPYCKSVSGVIVTASHNPPQDNGIKVYDAKGMESTVKSEMELEDIIFNNAYERASWNEVGRIEFDYTQSILSEYIEKLASLMTPKTIKDRIKVVVDCANGAASNVTPTILRKLGAKVHTLNCNIDGTFPGRYPEPRPDTLTDLSRAVVTLGCHAGFGHDGDADRLSVLDSSGNFIYNDRLIAFFAKLKLEEKKGIVVVSIDTSLAIDEVVERMGGKVVRTKLGKTHEKLAELGGKAILAAEPWKLIDPDWGFWVDGIYQATLLTKVMLENGVSIEKVLSDIPSYPQSRFFIRCPDDIKEAVVTRVHERMREVFKNEIESELDFDGLRLNLKDGSWVLVRASGTEPKIRGYCEARNPKRLKEIESTIKKLIQEELTKSSSKL